MSALYRIVKAVDCVTSETPLHCERLNIVLMYVVPLVVTILRSAERTRNVVRSSV